jgi:hypothetical protein
VKAVESTGESVWVVVSFQFDTQPTLQQQQQQQQSRISIFSPVFEFASLKASSLGDRRGGTMNQKMGSGYK